MENSTTHHEGFDVVLVLFLVSRLRNGRREALTKDAD